MNTLVTPLQVLKLAFGEGEYLPPEIIAEADIAGAEQRHIVPVVGRALYEKLLAGSYPDFRTEYLASPAALFTRAVLQPRLDVRTGQCGTTAPKSAYAQPAGDTARRHLRRALLAQARTLLHRAAEHLRAHRDEFPEYDPENDIFNRCTTDGGKAWRTVLKLALALTAISMAWLIDSCVLDFMRLNLARLLTGFTCGVELWSFLENAAQLSDAPLFRWLRRYVHRRIRKEAGDE